jgi:hypothetical protein
MNLPAFLNVMGLGANDYFATSLSVQLDALTHTVLYRTVSLLVCLYDGENLSLTLWKEMRPRGFEKRVLRKILCSNRVKVTVYWKKLRC